MARELIPHRAYFFCGYCDETGHVPSIETYIYLGTAEDVLGGFSAAKSEHIFQDADRYYEQQRGELSASASPEERGLVLVAEDTLDGMLEDYDGVVAFIQECKRHAP